MSHYDNAFIEEVFGKITFFNDGYSNLHVDYRAFDSVFETTILGHGKIAVSREWRSRMSPVGDVMYNNSTAALFCRPVLSNIALTCFTERVCTQPPHLEFEEID